MNEALKIVRAKQHKENEKKKKRIKNYGLRLLEYCVIQSRMNNNRFRVNSVNA